MLRQKGHAQLPLPTIYMLKTTDEIRRTGLTGRTRWADGLDGQADRRTEGRTGRRTGRRVHRRTRAPGGLADRQTSERGRARWTDERTEADTRWTGEQADEGRRARRQVDGRTDWRTGGRLRMGGRRISEGKTPNLTCQLTWPSKIQRGRPLVTVKLPIYVLCHGNNRVRHDVVPSSCRFCHDVVMEQGPSRHNRQPCLQAAACDWACGPAGPVGPSLRACSPCPPSNPLQPFFFKNFMSKNSKLQNFSTVLIPTPAFQQLNSSTPKFQYFFPTSLSTPPNPLSIFFSCFFKTLTQLKYFYPNNSKP